MDEIVRRLGLSALPAAATTIAAGGFVGRRPELSALHEALQFSRQGRPVLVRVQGPSGIGKTALLNRFLEEVRSSGGTTVLSGRCHERESVPYKAVDAVIDDLSHHLVRLTVPWTSRAFCPVTSRPRPASSR